MKTFLRTGLLAGCALAAVSTSPALAQDTSLASNYGSVSLDAAFAGDPYTVELTAGGSIEAYSLGAGCAGSISDAPDFELTYTAGFLSLYLSASSDGDVSLVVNTPDGSWVCDDDGASGLNPGLTFSDPQSGVYDIWVGSLGEEFTPATLYISELSYGDGSEGDFGSADGVDIFAEPNYGSVTLSGGFVPDPHSVSVLAGGSQDASYLDDTCRGYISGAPDYNLHFTPGSLPLYFSATGPNDLTLVVNLPDGSWACDDDGADNPLDPGIRLDKPASGLYNIWVGTYGEDYADSTLHISETGYHDTMIGGDFSGSGGMIDYSLSANYGDIYLSAGFKPDPHTVSLTPGGSIDASSVNSDCRGQVTAAPDYKLHYDVGGGPLYIWADSSDDTTLVINTPSGSWVCDDDSAAGLNPGVSFFGAESGRYDIWVGRYSGGASGSATLNISEAPYPN